MQYKKKKRNGKHFLFKKMHNLCRQRIRYAIVCERLNPTNDPLKWVVFDLGLEFTQLEFMN